MYWCRWLWVLSIVSEVGQKSAPVLSTVLHRFKSDRKQPASYISHCLLQIKQNRKIDILPSLGLSGVQTRELWCFSHYKFFFRLIFLLCSIMALRANMTIVPATSAIHCVQITWNIWPPPLNWHAKHSRWKWLNYIIGNNGFFCILNSGYPISRILIKGFI